MERFRKIVLILLLSALLTALFAGCDVDVDTSSTMRKPDIHAAIAAYQACPKKKSVFSAGFKVTVFVFDSKAEAEFSPMSIGQLLQVDRILNDGRIYLDATLSSAFMSDNFFRMANGLLALIPSDYANGETPGINPEIQKYINGEMLFAARAGYDGAGNYNAKGDYITKGDTPDYLDDAQNPLWFAVNDSSVLNIQKNMKTGTEYSIKDFVMLSGIIDLSVNDGWVLSDAADNYFNKDSQAYLYALTTSGAKLKASILDMIGKTSEGFDEEEYAEQLRLYADIFPTVAKWISAPDSRVNASVDVNGRLKSLSSSVRVDININFKELWTIAELLLSDEDKRMLPLAKLIMQGNFRSAAGQHGICTIRLDLTTDESFFYDDDSVSLEHADSDMFIPVSQKTEGRREIIVERD